MIRKQKILLSLMLLFWQLLLGYHIQFFYIRAYRDYPCDWFQYKKTTSAPHRSQHATHHIERHPRLRVCSRDWRAQLVQIGDSRIVELQ